MITEYTTADGYRLTIGRVPRQEIDRFVAAHPMPDPPMRTVEVWGDIPEEVPNYKDPEYLKALDTYLLELGQAQFDLILQAVTTDDDRALQDAKELQALKILKSADSFIKYILITNLTDIKTITEIIFYNSTVTPQGIAEAIAAYDIVHNDRKIRQVGTGGQDTVTTSRFYADRIAAQWAGYKWPEFCELTGPEQSEVVALHQLSNRIQTIFSRRA